jgi:hypothetical protein
MNALPKGWVRTGDDFRHVSGVDVMCYGDGLSRTHPDTGVHESLDAAIAALEPHVEAWREAVREAVAAEPVAAERDPLVDPAVGDAVACTTDSGEWRVYYVVEIVRGVVVTRAWSPMIRETWNYEGPLDDWRDWPDDWTVTVVRRGAS